MATTQIRQRQIEDGAINNAKIQAGAAIATNKLAEGSEFVKRDGSVQLTGDLNAGGNKVGVVAQAARLADQDLEILPQQRLATGKATLHSPQRPPFTQDAQPRFR